MAENVDVYDRLKQFSLKFVQQFEKKRENYYNVATEGAKTEGASSAIGKVLGVSTALIGIAAPVTMLDYSIGENIGTQISDKLNNTSSLAVCNILHLPDDKRVEFRKHLTRAAVEIFRCYEEPLMAIGKHGKWALAIDFLAKDAVDRVFTYLKDDIRFIKRSTEALDCDFITKGFANVNRTLVDKIMKSFDKTISFEYFNEKTGIAEEGESVGYHFKEATPKYGYRVKFMWDRQVISEKFKQIRTYENCLKAKNVEELAEEIVSQINALDPISVLNSLSEKMDEHTEDVKECIKGGLGNVANDLKKCINELGVAESKPTSVFFKVLKPIAKFSGRVEQIEKIHKKLQTNDSQILALCGLGGIGKSEIARKYAMTYKETYENVIWINSENTQSLNESFESLANKLRVSKDGSESIVEDVYQRFQSCKALFVFDNAENYAGISYFLPRYLLSDNKDLFVLITSRNKDWDAGDEGCFEVFTINQFDQSESFEYLKEAMGIRHGRCDGEIQLLADKLQHFPLAMSQAASYIKEHALSPDSYKQEISAYLSNYERELKTILEYKGENKSDRYVESIFTTWRLTFKQIEQHPTCGKEALQIINVMAYMAPDDICVDTIASQIVKTPSNRCKAIKLLQKFSLIGEEDKNKGNIQRIVQDVIRSNLDASGSEESALRKALTIIVNKTFVNTTHYVTVWSFALKYYSLFSEYYSKAIKVMGGHKLLHIFAKNGRDSAIKSLLENVSKKTSNVTLREVINKQDAFTKETALHLAASEGHLTVVKLLVDVYKAQTDLEEMRGASALTRAIEKGREDIVEVLSDSKNRDISLLTTQIYKAMNKRDCDKIKRLWNDQCTAENFEGLKLRPVIHAAYLGNLQLLKFLLDRRFDRNETNKRKTTPLLTACTNGHLVIVKYLTYKGRSLKTSDCSGETPLLRASKRGHLEVVRFLLDNKLADLTEKNDDDRTALIMACSGGKMEIATYLISTKGCDVKEADKYGLTPLLLASKNGHLVTVNYLLSVGSGVTETEQCGFTPLMFASKNGHFDIVKLLIAEGSDPGCTNNNGHTALDLARKQQHRDDVCSYLESCMSNFTNSSLK